MVGEGDDYRPERIEQYFRRRVSACEGSTWKEVAAKVGRLGHWEFDEYVEWTPYPGSCPGPPSPGSPAPGRTGERVVDPRRIVQPSRPHRVRALAPWQPAVVEEVTVADYLRGHPEHPKQVKDGALAHDGAGGLRFRKSMASVMPLPGQERKPDVVIEMPASVLQAVSVGALQRAASLAVGGLAPVGDDLLVGLGGILGGGESGAITCVLGLDGARHLVFFWAESSSARALVEGLQRERVALGLPPLPRPEELDARAESVDRADRLEQHLERIATELAVQSDLLRRIASALDHR